MRLRLALAAAASLLAATVAASAADEEACPYQPDVSLADRFSAAPGVDTATVSEDGTRIRALVGEEAVFSAVIWECELYGFAAVLLDGPFPEGGAADPVESIRTLAAIVFDEGDLAAFGRVALADTTVWQGDGTVERSFDAPFETTTVRVTSGPGMVIVTIEAYQR